MEAREWVLQSVADASHGRYQRVTDLLRGSDTQ